MNPPTPDLQKVRARLLRCRETLKRRDLSRFARWCWTRNLYYWYGFLDALTGKRP
jgi:hypothetical protein